MTTDDPATQYSNHESREQGVEPTDNACPKCEAQLIAWNSSPWIKCPDCGYEPEPEPTDDAPDLRALASDHPDLREVGAALEWAAVLMLTILAGCVSQPERGSMEWLQQVRYDEHRRTCTGPVADCHLYALRATRR